MLVLCLVQGWFRWLVFGLVGVYFLVWLYLGLTLAPSSKFLLLPLLFLFLVVVLDATASGWVGGWLGSGVGIWFGWVLVAGLVVYT